MPSLSSPGAAPNPQPSGNSANQGILSQTAVLLIGMVAVCMVAGIFLAALALPVVTVASSAADQGVDMLQEMPAELDVQSPNQASRIEAADGSLLAVFYSENRIMVPLEKISPNLQHAVVAIEDRRFYEHSGVDVKGISRALVANLMHKSTQGGSTLTQQYVKNALLNDAIQKGDEEQQKGAVSHSYTRKLREAKLALSLESRLTEKHNGDRKAAKDEILTGYLNIAQFGPSEYGVEAASRHFYSKSAQDLTPAEAALLAGLTNGPNLYDPVTHPDRALQRRNEVLADMFELGYISKAEYEEAKATPIKAMLKISNTRAGCQDAGANGFFCSYAIQRLLNDPKFGKTKKDRQRLLYGGGLTIKTTLDPRLQKIANDILERKVPATSESGFGHAIVTVEPGTGKVLAMAQNRRFNPRAKVNPGETSLNYMVPKIDGGGNGFEVGSTFKPFVLAQWLKSGHSIYDTVSSRREGIARYDAHCTPRGAWVNKRDPYNPKNSSNHVWPAQQSALDATKYSVNTSYNKIASKLDLCDITQTALDLGAYVATFDRESPNNAKAGPYQVLGQEIAPSVVVLGQIRVSALDMAAAYATFASGGIYCKPEPILSIKDSSGKELPFAGQECERKLPEQVANDIAYTLKQDLDDPRATGRGKTIPGHDAGGKTGTSNNQFHTWYVGFTKQLSTAVWFGHPNANIAPGGFNIDGEYLVRNHVWGSTVSLPTWHEFMTKASEGMPNVPFPAPPASPQHPNGAPEKPAPQSNGGTDDLDQNRD